MTIRFESKQKGQKSLSSHTICKDQSTKKERNLKLKKIGKETKITLNSVSLMMAKIYNGISIGCIDMPMLVWVLSICYGFF